MHISRVGLWFSASVVGTAAYMDLGHLELAVREAQEDLWEAEMALAISKRDLEDHMNTQDSLVLARDLDDSSLLLPRGDAVCPTHGAYTYSFGKAVCPKCRSIAAQKGWDRKKNAASGGSGGGGGSVEHSNAHPNDRRYDRGDGRNILNRRGFIDPDIF